MITVFFVYFLKFHYMAVGVGITISSIIAVVDKKCSNKIARSKIFI